MDADDLYGLPLDEFIPARGALAKALRTSKQREEATAVAALRKPSVAAWAVNQLVRTQRPAIQELFGAGDELRDAQAALLDGSGDGRALRAAGERERAAVEELVERARGLLSSAGSELSAAVVDRVSDTLHAAALDDDARERVRHGRLERELRHAGLGFGLGVSAEPEPREARPTRSGDSAPREGAPSPSHATKRTAAGASPKGEGAVGASATGGASSSEGAQRGAARKRTGRRGSSEGVEGASATEGPGRASGGADDATATKAAGRATSGRAEGGAPTKAAERERAARERAEAERVRRERAAARRDARAALATARRRADAAKRALLAAEKRRDEAQQELGASENALASARTDADDAGASLKRAEADLADAGQSG